MTRSLKIFGIVLFLVCAININKASSGEKNLWSRQVMICQQDQCSLDTITWQTNQERNNLEGYEVDKTRHYCIAPEDWEPILNSLIRKDGLHNNILLQKIRKGKCYEISIPKYVALFETVSHGEGWLIRRSQWLYDQPEIMYQGFILSHQ